MIVTNGAENSSSEFGGPGGKAKLKAIMDAKQNVDQWLIIFLGADQDAWGAGEQFSTQIANTMSFASQNVGATIAAAARGTSAYFAGRRRR